MLNNFLYTIICHVFVIVMSLLFSGCKTEVKTHLKIQDKNTFPAVDSADTSRPIRNDVACLIYHRFGDSRYPSTNISVKLFREQLQYLRDKQFQVLTFGEAAKLVYENKKILGKAVVITVDDGFLTFKTNALPLLKEFGYPVTLFVNTETIGAGEYLSWKDLSDMVKEGIEIGNHSHSHAYFLSHHEDKLSFFKQDVIKAKNLMNEKLGIEPKIFSYPYGEFDQDMMNEVRALGFYYAAAQNSGILCETSNPLAIPRFPINEHFGELRTFVEKVNMKALRIKGNGAISTLYLLNPPELQILFENDNYDLGRLQCFTQGGVPVFHIETDSLIHLVLTSNKKLTSRRVIYTITVPSRKFNQWYWFSHLWINPSIKD